jgi:DNA-directed RNA polymerase II subunit RPB9
MKFCKTCNNLLVPRENRELKKLEYVCKSHPCTYVERDIEESLVFRNDILRDTATNLRSIPSDMNKDPTLNTSRGDQKCEKCGAEEAVQFLAEQNVRSTKLQLILVCVGCGHKFFKTAANADT